MSISSTSSSSLHYIPSAPFWLLEQLLIQLANRTIMQDKAVEIFFTELGICLADGSAASEWAQEFATAEKKTRAANKKALHHHSLVYHAQNELSDLDSSGHDAAASNEIEMEKTRLREMIASNTLLHTHWRIQEDGARESAYLALGNFLIYCQGNPSRDLIAQLICHLWGVKPQE